MPGASAATNEPPSQELPSGTRLEEFIIEQVLGSGGFGITYLARDKRLGRQVVIKENLPAQFCWRDTTSLTVQPRHSSGEDADNFQYSLESFEKEAATLASLDHPGIVKVLRSFEANGTAYFVMPFVEGVTFDEVIKERETQNSPFSEEELVALLHKALAALGYLHERGIYHRDIKPGNLLVTAKGDPVLIDFGAARQRLSERSLTVIESPGYTPFEQMQSRGKVGPWSDLYALGGTVYKAITGETPAKAADRILEDPQAPLAERAEFRSRYSAAFLAEIDRGMRPKAAERWQSAEEWRDAGAKMQATAQTMSPVLPLPQQLKVALSTNDRVGGINNVRHPVAVSPKTNSYRSLSALCTRSSSARLAARLSELRVAAIARWLLGGAVALGGIVIVFANLLTQNRPNQSYQPAQAVVDAFATASKTTPFQNSLGMQFVRAGTPSTPGMLFSVWETRVKDFEAFVEETGHDAISNSTFGESAFTLEETADGKGAEWSQKGGSWIDPRFPTKQTGEHPVVCVSYLDAEAFCAWLTKRERAAGAIPRTASYRLPTDSEWSRAVGGSEFPWGENFPPSSDDGNYSGEETMVGVLEGHWSEMVKAGRRDSAARTAPVGMFKGNRFGLYDMGGNIWEWCSTWSTADLNDAEAKKTYPLLAKGIGVQTYRVLRGGSWNRDGRVSMLSAFRDHGDPRRRVDDRGFRVVLVKAGG